MSDEHKPIYFKQSEDERVPFNVPDSDLKLDLPEHIRAKMDKWLLRYPPDQKRSGIFEALRLVQAHNDGFLTVPWMDAVANYLGLTKIAVYEVATFYTMYFLNPVGKHVINVCTNISCTLNGAENLLAHLEQRLGIQLNETTADGKFTLKEVECLGACVAPPVCLIDKKYYERLTPEKIDLILADLKTENRHE